MPNGSRVQPSIFAVLLSLCFASAAFAAGQPPPRPRLPEPISPLYPAPGMPSIPGIPPKGDPQRGQKIYESWGCPTCHTLDGKGGKPGPDLSKTGETHTDAYWFRTYLNDPRSMIPTSVKPPVKLSEPDMDDLTAYLVTLRKFRMP